MTEFWQDKDRRRAALMSLLLHVMALLALVVFVSLPRPTPLEPFVVIDLGSPAPAETQADAATVDTPAPETPTPQVEADRIGRPSEPSSEPSEPAPTDQAETPPEDAPEPEETAQAAPPRPAPPAPVAPPPAPTAQSLPGSPAAPLPQIDEEPLAPRPLAESIPVPRPAVTADLPVARDIAPQPRAEVSEAQAVPRPTISAAVAEAQPVPVPSVAASVTTARDVPVPGVRAEVATGIAVPRPSVRADVASAAPVPRPAASAAVASPRPVPMPSATATVTAPQPEPEAESNRASGAPAGGDAVAPGQSEATAEPREGLGVAAGPEGREGTGVPPRPEPYSAFRPQPVAVLIDNANGYPQSGLVEAAVVIEMPVEGGITRLMPLYDEIDPATVGPVRSARDYFVRIAESYRGILVHDGGSPSAMKMISQSPTPTVNSFSSGELFARADQRSAPYNLYSDGTSLRRAINRLRPAGMRSVSGTIYRPPQEARAVEEVSVSYGAIYRTGFTFQPALGSYRWVRNGTPAVDATGEQVRATAVLVADIEARPYPDDPAGRLYIPLDGGRATLYLLGRAIDGTWTVSEGIGFRADDGTDVDLRPFKTWIAFTPTYEGRTER